MRLNLFILLFAIFATGVVAEPVSSVAACRTEQFDEISSIRYVHDGDTLHLQDGRKIRLIGINTPELARDGKKAEDYAVEARSALQAKFADNRSIALVYGKEKKDRYGRILAHAFTADGENIQASLLTQGLASAITIPPNTQFASCYLEMENRARCRQTGLWQNHRIIKAADLNTQQHGFQLIQGKLSRIEASERGLLLKIDDSLTVGIRSENLPLFDIKELHAMVNQIVVVRGWLNTGRQSTSYYLRLRHPLSLQPLATLTCSQADTLEILQH